MSSDNSRNRSSFLILDLISRTLPWQFKGVRLFAYLLFLITLASCTTPPLRLTRTQVIMHTPITLSLPKENERQIPKVFEIFRIIEKRITSYNDHSEIGRLNRTKSESLTPKTLSLLKRSLEIAQATSGAFDPTIGALTLGLYRFGLPGAKKPTPSAIKKARDSVDFSRVQIQKSLVTIPPATLIDFGGIGKGYAVDEASAYLSSRGIQSGTVAASGDIRCLSSCNLAIQHPFATDKNLLEFRSMGTIAISTSGSYVRKKSDSLHHLLDSKTGKSSHHFVSVTLKSKSDNTLLDALTTAVFVTRQENLTRLIKKFPGIDFLVITSQKEILVSEGFFQNLKALSWSDDKADFKIRKVTTK